MSVRTAAISLVAALVITVTVTLAGFLLTGLLGEDQAVADVAFEEQTAAQIQSQVLTDMAEVTSARVVGDITQGGSTTAIDLTQNSLGACVGTLSHSGGSAQMIVNAEGQFLKGDQKFWKAVVGSAAEAKRVKAAVGDKWAKMPEGRGGFGAFCTLQAFLQAFEDPQPVTESGDGAAALGGQATLEGLPAVELISEGETPTSAWVAVDAPHRILRLETAANVLNFSQFNGPVQADSPPAREVIDFTNL